MKLTYSLIMHVSLNTFAYKQHRLLLPDVCFYPNVSTEHALWVITLHYVHTGALCMHNLLCMINFCRVNAQLIMINSLCMHKVMRIASMHNVRMRKDMHALRKCRSHLHWLMHAQNLCMHDFYACITRPCEHSVRVWVWWYFYIFDIEIDFNVFIYLRW